jgi:outer membrane autotransporter protein
LTGTGTSKLNISNGTVNIGENTRISALDTTLNDTSLNIANENSLNGLDTTFNGTNNLNISNNNVGTLALGKVNLNGVLKMQVDADLAKAQMDQLTATSATVGNGGKIEVSKINLLSPTTQKRLDLLFTNNKNLASVVNYTGEGQIAYSPIYKYNTSYIQKSNGSGYFSFVTPGDGYNSFNPSVMASSVTAIVTGYQNQMQSLHDGFYHMERYMKHSKSYRFASENQNRVASLAPVTRNDINDVPETSQAMWTLPYSTFERVNLKGGVKVDNIAYGMTYGGDSNMFDMGHGFKGLVSAFVGYNGNHMSYDGISMTQNGGFLGATLNAYKGNFFTGLTVSTGASTGDAHTMYGQDNITLLTAGIANKTGYNFEFLDGKVILQPSLFLGYSWVNTFDYTNSAGVRINQDALNAMQIVPGIKIIGNTKNGWQPYAGIDMVWNVFMGRNRVTANDVILPQLSERAYVQYGVGVQKTWADRFTGFLQAMVRNGGRNGIVLSAGLRWTFGKENKKTKATAAKQKTVIKSINK